MPRVSHAGSRVCLWECSPLICEAFFLLCPGNRALNPTCSDAGPIAAAAAVLCFVAVPESIVS